MNVQDIFKLPAPVSKKRRVDQDHVEVHDEYEETNPSSLLDQVLDAAEEVPAMIDTTTLKKMILKFEKALSKNSEQRSKYPNDPLKYMDSEMDLAEEVKNMTAISSVPHLLPVLLNLSTHVSLLSLLSHENTDISIAAISLFNELTDEDALADTSPQGEAGTRKFLSALVEADGLKLMIQNLTRLSEDKPDEKQGFVENIVSIDLTLIDRIVNDTNIMPWLLTRIDTKAFDSVRQYSSEILAILLQTSRSNRIRLGNLDGVDKLLHALSAYRKKDPKEGDEIEMMENLFDSLCSCLAEPEIKTKFLQAEGIELLLIMIKEKKMSHMRAIKVLDHALLGSNSRELALHFVRALGLKTLFSAYMQKGMKRYKKEYSEYSKKEEEEHVMSILYSLFHQVDDAECRQRLIFKFMENDFEKTIRLVQLHKEYSERMKEVSIALKRRLGDAQLDIEDEEELYLEQLDAGLITLQNIDLVISYICVESRQVKEKLLEVFDQEKIPFHSIQSSIHLFLEHLGEKDEQEDTDAADDSVNRVKVQVLGMLLQLFPRDKDSPSKNDQ